MATYIIVDKDTDPLGPNEVPAGGTINVNSGDVFIVSDSAGDTIKFDSATGNATSFEIRFETSNTNDFDIEIEDNLDAEINISSAVDLSDVDIKAEQALSVVLTAGDNVSLGKFDGSEDGVDLVTIGNGFSTDEDIKLNGGDNVLTIGDHATIEKIETGNGDNYIAIGDGLFADDIKTGDGNDTIVIGDNAFIDKIETDKGNDRVTIGDSATLHEVKTEEGDDIVKIGSGGSIDKIDGGKGYDALNSQTVILDTKNFETICFARGTRIKGEYGDVSIETLQEGDWIRTLDHGLQCIRWIGSTRVAGRGVHAPVRIAAGALGNARTLWVSQQHRMLMSGWKVELHFGEEEALVPAKHLVGLAGIQIVEVATVEYFHILFDQHEIVFAEGIESESFHPGAVGLGTLSEAACREIYDLFPELMTYPEAFGKSYCPSLKSFEADVLAL